MSSLDLTAAAMIEAVGRTFGGQFVYSENGRNFIATEHLAAARSMAAVLQSQHGISPGDRVAVLAPTSLAYIQLWHAALLGYFTIVPVNSRLAPYEIVAILENAEPALLIAGEPFRDLAAQSAALSNATTSLLDMAELVATDAAPAAPRTLIDPEEVPAILYTGGTTSLPKGVELTQQAYALKAYRLHTIADFKPLDSCLSTTVALFHVSSMMTLLGPFLLGRPTYVTSGFDVPTLIEDSRRLKLTHLSMVPTMIERFAGHPDFDPADHHNLRSITYGGAPISRQTIDLIAHLLPKVELTQSYGMTEQGVLTVLSNSDHRCDGERRLSCGRPLVGTDVVACDENGTPVEAGVSGELYVRTHGGMRGYWRNAEATDAALKDGWYRTGDVGRFDADGYLYIVDRAKDMIITGGENVYSLEVERAIQAIEGVAQAAVFGVPSEQWGEQVHAIIVPKPGVTIDDAYFTAEIRRRLAGYKCPKSWEMRSQPLPLSGANKIAKITLKKDYMSRLDTTASAAETDKVDTASTR